MSSPARNTKACGECRHATTPPGLTALCGHHASYRRGIVLEAVVVDCEHFTDKREPPPDDGVVRF